MDDAQPFDTLRAQFRIERRGLVRSHPAGARRIMRGQALLGMGFLDRLESWEVRADRLMLHGYP